MSKLIIPGKRKDPHEAFGDAATEEMQRTFRRLQTLMKTHGIPPYVGTMVAMPMILSLVSALIDEVPEAGERQKLKLLAAWPFVQDLDRGVVMKMMLNGGVINAEVSDVPGETQH